MRGRFDWDLFEQLPVVGILRGFDVETVLQATEAAYRGGLRTIEIALNSAGAAEQITALRERFDARMNVGAGTVRDLAELESALGAGAEFVVTPVVDEAVIRACLDRGVPVVPGAFTPTEIHRAWSLGAPLVKLFPGGRLGPSYIREVMAPLDQVRLVPTGGVNPDNLAEFFAAGAAGAGVGSTLFQRGKLEARDWDWVAAQARRYVEAFRKGDVRNLSTYASA
jgi:2-dehydro-3-deoxyphosphogluconate aldolase / (4S)-4-hydroxy-2-oxoglutarate aldolase